ETLRFVRFLSCLSEHRTRQGKHYGDYSAHNSHCQIQLPMPTLVPGRGSAAKWHTERNPSSAVVANPPISTASPFCPFLLHQVSGAYCLYQFRRRNWIKRLLTAPQHLIRLQGRSW